VLLRSSVSCVSIDWCSTEIILALRAISLQLPLSKLKKVFDFSKLKKVVIKRFGLVEYQHRQHDCTKITHQLYYIFFN